MYTPQESIHIVPEGGGHSDKSGIAGLNNYGMFNNLSAHILFNGFNAGVLPDLHFEYSSETKAYTFFWSWL